MLEDSMPRGSGLLWWIVIFKVIKAALLIALGAFLLEYLHRGPLDAVLTLANAVHLPATSHLFMHAVSLAIGTTPAKQATLGATAFGYAAIFCVEAVGLARRRGWARWFTIGITASLLPFELYEIVQQPRAPLRIATFIVNIGIVIYLYKRKEAFEP